jgi:hypothetical protein
MNVTSVDTVLQKRCRPLGGNLCSKCQGVFIPSKYDGLSLYWIDLLDGWAKSIIYRLSARSTEKPLVRWGVQSLLLFSLPGSVNASAYPIQAPFEEGREESQIESGIVLWVLLCALGGFSMLQFYFSVNCAGPRGLFRIS